MATTQTYKVLFNNVTVKSSPFLLSSTLGKLKKDALVEVIDITGLWARIKYNNKYGYVIILYLEKVKQIITGSITIKYLNIDTNVEVSQTVTKDNLSLNTYSYTAPPIENYTVIEPSTKSATLTNSNPNQEIVFYYNENIIYGSVTINYVDKSTNQSISKQKIYKDLNLGIYSYSAIDIAGYKINGDSSKSVTLTKYAKDQSITFEYEKNITDDDIYVIDLKKYGISNDNTNGNATTIGINQALIDAKAAGYKRVKLPEGVYSIDTSIKNPIVLSDGTSTWTHNRQGISMQSNMELILDGTTLQIIPCEDPYYSIVTISNCKNSKITGGTILGDRETHDYGMRINENGDMFESGDFDSTTGEPKVDDSKVRTKDFISVYKNWFTGNEEPLPTKFYIIPLWNTSMNTVDGGCRYIYCYDKDGKYLGIANGGIGYIKQAALLPNTAKIKISVKDEKRLDIVLSMTKRTIYYTYEFGSGLTVTSSNSVELNGITIKNCIGDCICTIAPPLKVTVDNLNILNCTLENSRRQGISFVSTGENYLVQGCNIGKINGVDPQCGIDFEHYDYVRDVVIDKCNFYDNKKWDIINYNGNNIEVKDSNFNGGIASTYGWNMDIHNNIFKYEDNPKVFKSYNGALFSLNTNKTDSDNIFFKIYENTIENYSAANSGNQLFGSTFENNTIKNCTSITIRSKGSNKFYNSNIFYNNNPNMVLIENSYYENCNIGVNNDSPAIEFNNCLLEDSQLRGRGTTTIKKCSFNMTTKSIIDAWATDATTLSYKDCNIISSYTSKIPVLGSNTKFLATFDNCIFNLSRYWIGRPNKTFTFNNCSFKFIELSQSSSICYLNTFDGNPTWTPDFWYFNSCTFESSLPVEISGTHVSNPTIIGDIRILNK